MEKLKNTVLHAKHKPMAHKAAKLPSRFKDVLECDIIDYTKPKANEQHMTIIMSSQKGFRVFVGNVKVKRRTLPQCMKLLDWLGIQEYRML